MEDGRLELGRMVLGRLQKFLSDYHIPATIRVKVLESIVQSTCVYGAEVWGGAQKDCGKVQAILNEGLRYITQGKATNATSVSVMQLELDLCPIYPVIAKKRMRVGWKGHKMSVTLGNLIESRTSWHSSVSTYLMKTKRIGIFLMKQYDKASDKLREEQKERIKNKYNPEKVFWNKKDDRFLNDLIPFLWCDQIEDQSLWNYLYSGRAMNRMYMNVWFNKPEWARGCQVILSMRVGCWYPGERMVPFEDNALQMSCPCCGEGGKETLKHYVVECNKFSKEREEMSSRIKNRLGLDPEAELDIWLIFKIVIGIDFYSEHGPKRNTTDDTEVKKGKTIPARKHVILRSITMHKSSDCIFTRRREASRRVLCELYGRSWNTLTKEKSDWRDSIYCERLLDT